MVANGQLDESRMVTIGSGWDDIGQWFHKGPPGTIARWQEMVRLAVEKYGVRLRVTPGWNIYRPLSIQRVYRDRLGVYAAVPGYSSHGGEFQGRECCAIDVQNWGDLAPGNASLAWSRFVALCRIVGFTVDFVTPQELWHVGDFNPWSVPQFASITIKPIPVPPLEEDMLIIVQRQDSQLAKGIYDPTTGRIRRHISKAENNLLRSAEGAGGRANGTILYGTVSDDDFKALGG